jgi:tetratricopeptide (TPR) repeat protein
VSLARESGNPSNLVNALWALGWAIQHEEPEAALAAFEESASLTRDGASDAVYGSALARIGTLRAPLGDAIGALRALREAISFCHEIGNHTTVVGAFGCGVVTLSVLGHREHAAVLAGAMQAPAFVDIDVFSSQERVENDQTLEQLRETLGSERFAEAEARGAVMSYEEAVEYALAELDRLIAELAVEDDRA